MTSSSISRHEPIKFPTAIIDMKNNKSRDYGIARQMYSDIWKEKMSSINVGGNVNKAIMAPLTIVSATVLAGFAIGMAPVSIPVIIASIIAISIVALGLGLVSSLHYIGKAMENDYLHGKLDEMATSAWETKFAVYQAEQQKTKELNEYFENPPSLDIRYSAPPQSAFAV